MYMKSIEDSVTALPERRNIEDIKKSYPDEWIILGEPEMDEFRQNFILHFRKKSTFAKKLLCPTSKK